MRKDKPEIVFITRGLGLGGAQKILVFVANSCVEAGYAVTIISLSDIKPTLEIKSEINIKYVCYDANKINQYSRPKKLFYQLLFLVNLRRALVESKPDLVIAFLSDVLRMVVHSLFGLRVPLIGSERGNPLGYLKKDYKKYSKAYKKCNAVVFQTQKAKNAYGLEVRKKSIIISNPCIPRLKPIEPYFGTRRKIIAAAGRLDDQKRFDLLICAFNKVIERYPDYKLNIYGEGERRNLLERKIDELNLKENVFLKGEVKDVFAKINNCTAFVLSSDYEGVPNVLIEAMSIGIPCISTDCDPGGPRQLLDDGRRGLLVPVGDIDGLADSICKYIEDPKTANEFGQLGMEVNQELSPDVISEKWLEIIKSTLKQPKL